jgi:mono/diheme cytochrome c family protein
MLVFFDAQDREIGRYKFPENPASGTGTRVLIATREFAALSSAPQPDFIMPALMSPVNGKVCFQGNTENPFRFDINHCASYGKFTGNTQFAGPPAPALSTTDALSLQRRPNASTHFNSDFVRGAATPTNAANQSFMFPLVSLVKQGETLFEKETFMGNGRTCGQCHVTTLSGGLTPANIKTRFATLADTFDPLFIGEIAAAGFDFNFNTLVITARPTHQSGSDFQNASGGDLQGIVTSALGVRAKIAAKVGATTYRIYGGLSPPLSGSIKDAFGNTAFIVSVTPGDLDQLEAPLRMRTSVFPGFPDGRGLILENIDGFDNPPVFRKSPHILNLRDTAPFGFNGDIPDLRTFSTAAVIQHLPRSLARTSASAPGTNPDFRLPTADELAALEAFMLAQEFPAGDDPDKFNLDRFVATAAARRGRDAFFGPVAKCSQCHGGKVLAQTTVNILGKGIGVNAAFNTGVMHQPINSSLVDDLPCEPSVGVCHSREFSTPTLFNVKNLGPWFHDGSAPTLRAAVDFYDTPAFNNSPAGMAIGGIRIDTDMAADITAFLESLSEFAGTTISGLNDVAIAEDVITPIPFTVSPPDAVLSAFSSNTELVPVDNITVTGTGAERTLTITPALDLFGTATITIEAMHGEETVGRSFILTVRPINDFPMISPIADQSVAHGTAMLGPLPMTVGDAETLQHILFVTGSSSNQAVVPDAGIAIGGTETDRPVTLTFAPGARGSAVITLTVHDEEGDVAATSFTVTVASPPPPPPPPPGPTGGTTEPPPPPGPAPTPIAPPSAPSGLIAIVRDSAVDLSWSAAAISVDASREAEAATGYRIEVGTASGLRDRGVFTTGVTTTFTVEGLAAGTYSIRVRAFNAGGESGPSNEVVATIVPPGTPSAPRNVQATVNGRSVQLSWQLPIGSIPILAFQLEVGSAPGRSDLAIAVVPTLSITAAGVADGTYFIRVRALNALGVGPASNEIAVTVGVPPPCTAPPSMPMNLTGAVTGNVVSLSWLPPASGATRAEYAIVVGSSPGQSNLAVIPVGRVNSITAPAPNGTYFVRVVATNACGSSAPSNEIVVAVGVSSPPVFTASPGPPARATAHASGTEVSLAWSSPTTGDAVTRYIIQVLDDAGNPIVTVDTGNAATTFTQSGVAPGVYRVRIAGANAGGIGPFTNPVEVEVGR